MPVGHDQLESVACHFANAKCPALRVAVEGDGDDQDQPGRDRLPEGRNAEEVERVGDDAEQEDADDGPVMRPRPPPSEAPPTMTAAIAVSS